MMSPYLTLSPKVKCRLLLKLSQEIGRTLDLEEVLRDLLGSVRTAVAFDASSEGDLEFLELFAVAAAGGWAC